MIPNTSQTSLGEYCIAYDERAATFATPWYRCRAQYVVVGFFVFLAILMVVLGMAVGDPKVDSSQWYGMGLFSLALAIGPLMDTGINQITFDLKCRTYKRTFFGAAVLGGTADFPGLGNRFRRKTACGKMEEILGVAILERTGHYRKIYVLHLRWANNTQPPMAVGFLFDRLEAREQAGNIADFLSLPLFGD